MLSSAHMINTLLKIFKNKKVNAMTEKRFIQNSNKNF